MVTTAATSSQPMLSSWGLGQSGPWYQGINLAIS